jgi:hypothetical protein
VAGRCGGAVVAVWREPSPAPPDLVVQYRNPRELAEAAAVASATLPALERHCCSLDGPGLQSLLTGGERGGQQGHHWDQCLLSDET